MNNGEHIDARLFSRSTEESGQHKKKQRFTVLDFFFVVILLLCLVGVIFRTTIAGLFADSVSTESIAVGFKIEAMEKNEYDAWDQTAAVRSGESLLGTVSDIVVTPYQAIIPIQSDDGTATFIRVEDSERVSVHGYLTVTGRYTDLGFAVDDFTVLTVGKILKVSAGSSVLTVIITEIPRRQ